MPVLQKSFFSEHQELHHAEHTHIYTDGSKTNTGVGFAVVFPYKTIKGTLQQECSIYTAELTAILAALNEIENSTSKNWVINTDSRSAMDEIQSFACSHPIAEKIQELIPKLQKTKHITFCKIPSHVGLRGNELADKAAKRATEIPGHYSNKISLDEAHKLFRKITNSLWQTRWDTHSDKLGEIRPTIVQWIQDRSLIRGHQVKLSRLRIGHTRLTHGYLMKISPQPFSTRCSEPLTVKHILIS